MEQLYDDLTWIKGQLDSIKAEMIQIGTSLKPSKSITSLIASIPSRSHAKPLTDIDAAMKIMGLTSFSELEAAIVAKCSSDDVAKWKAADAKMDKDSQIEGSVFGVVNIVAATTGVVGLALTFAFPPIGGALGKSQIPSA